MGCGRVAPRAHLARFANVDGCAVPDPRASLPGRGAWLHPNRDCFEAATARRAFHRAFRAPVNLSQETVDLTQTWPRSASTS
ncbi:YlxR family protein [Solirubrobacter sp. CPCC 204708]|uniref:YlxR family protein n=1 Tax=Solirubrobacter deserti TaxID=2282478 RepID=UPI001930A2CE|nr:YlxR family protein [Solirubrobacter deserti]